MFNSDLMDQFRMFNENDPCFKISDELQNAWFIFLKDFCPCVSYEWTNYLAHLSRDHRPGFHGFLSASDEAFAIWSIRIKYQRMKEEVEKENLVAETDTSATKEKEKKGKRGGAHDSRLQIDSYVTLYHNCIIPRLENEESANFWEKCFIDQYLEENDVTDTSTKCKEEYYATQLDQLPFDFF